MTAFNHKMKIVLARHVRVLHFDAANQQGRRSTRTLLVCMYSDVTIPSVVAVCAAGERATKAFAVYQGSLLGVSDKGVRHTTTHTLPASNTCKCTQKGGAHVQLHLQKPIFKKFKREGLYVAQAVVYVVVVACLMVVILSSKQASTHAMGYNHHHHHHHHTVAEMGTPTLW